MEHEHGCIAGRSSLRWPRARRCDERICGVGRNRRIEHVIVRRSKQIYCEQPSRARSSSRTGRAEPQHGHCSRLAEQAEVQARERRQEIVGLEQILADKTRSLADRIAGTDRLEQDLRARDKHVRQQEQAVSAAHTRAEQLIADRQRELQRVAGMTADEARELLLKQLESDARRDAANLVKRLEAEARETATIRAQHIITDGDPALRRGPHRRHDLFDHRPRPATTSRGGSSGRKAATSARSKRRPVWTSSSTTPLALSSCSPSTRSDGKSARRSRCSG